MIGPFSGLGEHWGAPGPCPGGAAVQWNLPLPALAPGAHRIATAISLYGPGDVAGGWVQLQVEE